MFPVSQQEIAKWTADMVAIPSYPGIVRQEHAVAEYIQSVFAAEGIDCRIDELPDGRANAVAVVKGSGGGRSLMFNGHMDTVPPYDMPDACVPRLVDGRLYGRGTADMKGPLATMMAAVIAVKRAGTRLRGDVIFAGVADEEQGSLGTIHLLESGLRADGAIVGEPLSTPCLGIAQRGLEWYQVDFEGRTVHGGSQSTGINAIEKAAQFLRAVDEKLKPALAAAAHPILGTSSVNIAVIRGGTQPSTVAGQCMVQLDRRFLPSEPYEQVGAQLQALLDDLAAEDPDFHAALSVMPESVMESGYVHTGFETALDDPLVGACRAAGETILGRALECVPVTCWTDAGLLSHYGHIPTVVWGPGGMELCHSREEFIEPADMHRCAQGYYAALCDFCR